MILRHANGLMTALVLLAVVLFAALPSIAPVLPEELAPTEFEVLHHGYETPVHQPDADASGHCHPGLDCFSPAVFILAGDIPPPVFVTTAAYLTPFHMVDDIRPDTDLPPPRRHS